MDTAVKLSLHTKLALGSFVPIILKPRWGFLNINMKSNKLAIATTLLLAAQCSDTLSTLSTPSMQYGQDSPPTVTCPAPARPGMSTWKKFGYAALGLASLTGRATAQFNKNLFTTIEFPGYELLNINVANISDSIYKAYVGTLYNPTSNLEQGLVFMGTDDGNVSWYDTLAVNTSLLQVETQSDIIIAGGNTNQTLTGLGAPNIVLYRNLLAGNSPAVLMGGAGNYTQLCHLKIADNGNLGVVGTLQEPGSEEQYAYFALFDGEAPELPFLNGRKKAIGTLGCDNTVMSVDSHGDFIVNFKSQEMAVNDTYVAYMAQLNPSTSAVEAYRFVQGLPGALDLGFKLQTMVSDIEGTIQVVGYNEENTGIYHVYDAGYALTKQASLSPEGLVASLKFLFAGQTIIPFSTTLFGGEYNGRGFLARYPLQLSGLGFFRKELDLAGYSQIVAVILPDEGGDGSYYGIRTGELIMFSLMGGEPGGGGNNIELWESPASCQGIISDLTGFLISNVNAPAFSNSALQTSGDFGTLSAFDCIEWPAGLASTAIAFNVTAVCGNTDSPTAAPSFSPTTSPSATPTKAAPPAPKSTLTDDVLSITIPIFGVLGTLTVVSILILNRRDIKKQATKKQHVDNTSSPAATTTNTVPQQTSK